MRDVMKYRVSSLKLCHEKPESCPECGGKRILTANSSGVPKGDVLFMKESITYQNVWLCVNCGFVIGTVDERFCPEDVLSKQDADKGERYGDYYHKSGGCM